MKYRKQKKHLLGSSQQRSDRVAGGAQANIWFHSGINLQQLVDYFRNRLCIVGAEFQVALQSHGYSQQAEKFPQIRSEIRLA